MAIIKNKLRQRISIELEGGKSIGLLSQGKAKIPDAALTSPFLKRHLDKGNIVVLASSSEKKSKEKDTEEVVEKKGKSIKY
jgi:hypothetical protein